MNELVSEKTIYIKINYFTFGTCHNSNILLIEGFEIESGYYFYSEEGRQLNSTQYVSMVLAFDETFLVCLAFEALAFFNSLPATVKPTVSAPQPIFILIGIIIFFERRWQKCFFKSQRQARATAPMPTLETR